MAGLSLVITGFNSRMTPQNDPKSDQQLMLIESSLRRSSRPRKQPNNDCYLVGSNYLQNVLGQYDPEEDSPNRHRRYNRTLDDSEDYEDNHRAYRRRQHQCNRLEALLQWKVSIPQLPIVLVKPLAKQVPLYRTEISRNIVNENLAAYCQDVLALLVNIDWHSKGQTMKDFQNLKIENTRFMSRGLVFIWVPKEIISDLFKIMEKKGFNYVENLEIINLDLAKALELIERRNPVSKETTQVPLSRINKDLSKQKERSKSKKKVKETKTVAYTGKEVMDIVKLLPTVDPCDLMALEPSEYFNQSKRTLMIFRKTSNSKLELRHQRTCDVVFDMPSDLQGGLSEDIKSYIYNMIETLLPDCLRVESLKEEQYRFKMIELWASAGEVRRGWISVSQE